MSNFPTCSTITDAVLKGIVKTKENFLYWTNGRLFLSYGPNKIITIHIAQEISKLDNAPEIYIDATVADILKCSLNDRNAYTSYMEKQDIKQGVFSITLDERFEHKNDKDLISRAIISVKNGVRSANLEYQTEIDRICKMLDRDICKTNNLNFGIFAAYCDLSENARKKLSKRLPEIKSKFDTVLKKFPSLQGTMKHTPIQKINEAGEWCAFCYVIQPK